MRSRFVLPEGQALGLRSVAFGWSTRSGAEGTGKGTVATETRARSKTLLSPAAFSDADGDAHTCAHFAFAPVLVFPAVGLTLVAITSPLPEESELPHRPAFDSGRITSAYPRYSTCQDRTAMPAPKCNSGCPPRPATRGQWQFPEAPS